MAVTPWSTRAGVFGITRMSRGYLPRIDWMVAVDTPAAIEIRSGRFVRAGMISRSTEAMICGLTARMTTSAPRTSAALSASALTPNWSASWRARAARTSAARILSAGTRFDSTRPRMSASPMLPAPTKPTFLPLTLMPHLSGRRGTRGGRGPKIAVPTRTMVAPSSTAISKSPLIPIDSSGSPWRSASLRSERNQPRASSARSTAGGIAISPRSRSPPSFVSASTAVSTASGGQPPFDGSRPTLTCTSASTGRPRARARRSSSRARSMRSTEWTTSNSSSASRTLFVWRWPTRCHATGRPSSATLPRASCTRFSPSAVSPAARAARMRATSTVLDTPTSSTSSARRPARSAARAMRSRTRSRLVRMSGCISSTGDSSTRFCYPRNVMPPLSDLALMIQSRYPFIAVETSEEDRLETTLSRVAGDLRVPFFVWTVTNGLHRHGLPNAIYDSQQPLKGLNNVAAMTGEALFLMKDLHRYLTDPAVVRKCLDLAPAFGHDRRVIVMSAAKVELPSELEPLTARLTLALPGADELKSVVKRVVAECSRERPVSMGLSLGYLDRLVARLRGFTEFEAERAITQAILRDNTLDARDIDFIVELKKEMLRKDGVLEYISPEENLAEVGGFKNLKAWLAKRKKAFTPEAKTFGIDPGRGILLLGVQGCGKTMVARAVAREWGLPLLKMEPARLYDKYIGETEKNLDKALRMAEQMAPCVLMIDELEKGLSYNPGGDADAGLSKRIFGRLLAWLQDRKAPVFVVATSNDIGQLPPELTRKGRFDEIFFVDLPNAEERTEIFAVHLRKRKRDPKLFDLAGLAAASEGFSGAEIEQAVVAGLYTAFSRGVEVSSGIIVEELKATKPLSVTRAETIGALREWARDRTVMAS